MAENRKSGRIGALDEWRGFAILLMVLYHAGYDLVEIFGVNIPFFFSPFMSSLQTIIAGSFILLSGIVCRFSRNNLKRGIVVLGFALIMTVATFLVMPDMLIAFGILHLLGSCMIIFAISETLLDKVNVKIGLIITAVLFLLFYGLPNGFLGFSGFFSYPLPLNLYKYKHLFFIGLPRADFYSSDYFPLLPWLFLFILGSYLGIYFKQGKAPKWLYTTRFSLLAKVGKHTLIIYILHQPILMAVFEVFFWIFKL